ncbi:MAG TPA: hypothetical protein VLB46_16135 [Pyrinomonadaceae bacterium]|nr:hypothetical protein [Pyrinomonadaceae bacterium]
MSNKPNFWKLILGVVVLSLFLIAGLAATSARLTSLNPPAGDPITGVFELDGNIFEGGIPGDDWTTVNCTNSDNADVKTGVLFDGLGPTVFTTGGSKDDLDVTSWRHKTDQNSPPKDEILNAYAAKYTGSPAGDSILAFGADKFDTSGTAFIGAWFFKTPVVAASDGRFRTADDPSAPLASHSIGDVLVLLNFPGGGTNFADKKVFEWVGVGGPCVAPATRVNGVLCDISNTGQANSIEGLSNLTEGPQAIPGTCSAWVHDPKNGPDGTIQTNAFFEGAINISDFPQLTACFASFLLETRSSDSVGAQLKDFVLGAFNTCAAVAVTKGDGEVCAGVATSVSQTIVVHNTSPVAENVSLVDDNGTPADCTDDIDVIAGTTIGCVPPGTPTTVLLAKDDKVAGSGPDQATYTLIRNLTLTGAQTDTVIARANASGSQASATASGTVTVNSLPSITIDSFSCNPNAATLDLTATASGGSGNYVITFDGVTCAPGSTCTITRGPGVYTATVTDSKSCTSVPATRKIGLCTD